jgi:hypothetical protein
MVCVAPVQLAKLLHTAPAGQSRQLPLPSHLPSVPHVIDAVTGQLPLGSVTPAETLAQVPLVPPVSAPRHDWHFDVHAESQQTWLPAGPTHVSPVWHWLVAVHDVPLVSLVTHWCDVLQ